MQRFMARAVYTLTTPDGRAVGTLYEAQGNALSVQLDPAFLEATRQGEAGAGEAGIPRLVLVPAPRG